MLDVSLCVIDHHGTSSLWLKHRYVTGYNNDDNNNNIIDRCESCFRAYCPAAPRYMAAVSVAYRISLIRLVWYDCAFYPLLFLSPRLAFSTRQREPSIQPISKKKRAQKIADSCRFNSMSTEILLKECEALLLLPKVRSKIEMTRGRQARQSSLAVRFTFTAKEKHIAFWGMWQPPGTK